jgi:hypothetical protein
MEGRTVPVACGTPCSLAGPEMLKTNGPFLHLRGSLPAPYFLPGVPTGHKIKGAQTLFTKIGVQIGPTTFLFIIIIQS